MVIFQTLVTMIVQRLHVQAAVATLVVSPDAVIVAILIVVAVEDAGAVIKTQRLTPLIIL